MKNGEHSERDKLFLAMYLRGASHREIAAATNLSVSAIQQRICRKGLRKTKDAARAAAVAPKLTLAQCDEIIKEKLALDLVDTADALPQLKRSRDPVEAKLRADTVNVISQTAERVCGWNVRGGVTNTSFNTFNFEARTVGPCTPPVIDVESQPAT